MKRRRESLFQNLIKWSRNNLITGILVLAPFGAVFWIVIWFWNVIMGLVNLFPAQMHPTVFLGITNPWAVSAIDFFTTLIVFGITLLAVCLVGVISRNYLGRRVIQRFSRMIVRVPVVRTVYSTLQQLTETFGSAGSKNFRRVVRIEYPRKGLFTLAFVTGEREGLLTVYVPTTPNPTSGFYLLVAPSEVIEQPISVEDALKEIISMGIVQKHG